MSDICFHIWQINGCICFNVTDSVFLQRFRIFLGQCGHSGHFSDMATHKEVARPIMSADHRGNSSVLATHREGVIYVSSDHRGSSSV